MFPVSPVKIKEINFTAGMITSRKRGLRGLLGAWAACALVSTGELWERPSEAPATAVAALGTISMLELGVVSLLLLLGALLFHTLARSSVFFTASASASATFLQHHFSVAAWHTQLVRTRHLHHGVEDGCCFRLSTRAMVSAAH